MLLLCCRVLKISPYVDEMKKENCSNTKIQMLIIFQLKQLLQNRLGFTGREEGAAAMATVST
jgi:2C-methyl-D-erythritol 2,4-cyclodiphosphate synthase